MANHTVKWNNTKLKAAIQNLLCPPPGGPKVYALDTEYSLRRTAPEVTEVAFVDIRSGQVVVDAAFDDYRALVASSKMAFRRQSIYGSHCGASAPRPVPQVRTFNEMAQQIRGCHFQEDDIFIEYSKMVFALVDINNVRRLISSHGLADRDLMPSNQASTVLAPIKKILEQILPIDCFQLQHIFRILFPQDPLVDKNHSAVVDALQLARVVNLLVELAKSPAERRLPQGLLQGLQDLPSFTQMNTLDDYFKL
jgi:hypothetical protein